MIQQKKINILYITLILIFSIFVNQYYGNIGVNPIDSFFSFNSGYDVLNGYYPFKDYWTITGPFIAFIQAIFFKILGVSWFSYVFHASILNFILAISTYFTLSKFNLNLNYCFFYSILVALLAYPSAGTPYVDHQSAYISIISIFCFILAIKTKQKKYWFFLPIIVFISFLTKQAPTGHIFLIIVILSIIYFINNFNIKNIIYGLAGSLLIILIFFSLLYFFQIPLNNFFHQYILFPMSLGESRLNFLFPLEFNRIVLRFKLIHLTSIIIIFITIKNILQKKNYLIENEIIINVSLILTSYAFIIHQLMTINGIFIFFVIPILSGFSHIYINKYLKNNNYLLYILIFINISSALHYGNKYIHKRDFMDLSNANRNIAIDAKILDKKLKGLKWITPIHPKNPKEEINMLIEAINIIKKNNTSKAIITDYQFISVILDEYDKSPSQVWFTFHANPEKGSKYFKMYKDFYVKKIKENNVKTIYLVKPLWGGDDIFENTFNKKCYEKINETNILDKYILMNCSDLGTLY